MHKSQAKDGQFKGSMGSSIKLDLKTLTDEGVFEGYCSVFNTSDQGRDIVMPGAFTESLAVRPASQVKLLWQHDSWKPIGVWEEFKEDTHGLWGRGRLSLDVEKGKEAHALLKMGAMEGLSIGYRTIEEEYDGTNRVRRLLKLDLREVSVVTFPMHEDATVSTIKGGERTPTKRELEQWLVRDAGLSASQAKAILADGYKSIETARDAGETDLSGILQSLREARANNA